MPEVITTVGGANSNSYVTVAEVLAYFAGSPYATAFVDADVETQAWAVIQATRLLDSHYDWNGYATYPGVQALGWPRQGLYAKDGTPLPGDIIPVEIKAATCEQALAALSSGSMAGTGGSVSTGGGDALKSVKAGPVEIVWPDSGSSSSSASSGAIPDAVSYLIPAEWYTASMHSAMWHELERA